MTQGSQGSRLNKRPRLPDQVNPSVLYPHLAPATLQFCSPNLPAAANPPHLDVVEAPPRVVIDLARHSHEQLMALAARHNASVGAAERPTEEVLRGLAETATMRDPELRVYPWSMGINPNPNKYSKAWRSILWGTKPRVSAAAAAAAAAAAGGAPGAAAAPAGATADLPRSTSNVAGRTVMQKTDAFDSDSKIPRPSQSMLSNPQPEQLRFNEVLSAFLGRPVNPLPLLAPDRPTLDLRRLYLDVVGEVGGYDAVCRDEHGWATMAVKHQRDAGLSELLRRVYEHFLLPVERSVPPGRAAQFQNWLEPKAEERKEMHAWLQLGTRAAASVAGADPSALPPTAPGGGGTKRAKQSGAAAGGTKPGSKSGCCAVTGGGLPTARDVDHARAAARDALRMWAERYGGGTRATPLLATRMLREAARDLPGAGAAAGGAPAHGPGVAVAAVGDGDRASVARVVAGGAGPSAAATTAAVTTDVEQQAEQQAESLEQQAATAEAVPPANASSSQGPSLDGSGAAGAGPGMLDVWESGLPKSLNWEQCHALRMLVSSATIVRTGPPGAACPAPDIKSAFQAAYEQKLQERAATVAAAAAAAHSRELAAAAVREAAAVAAATAAAAEAAAAGAAGPMFHPPVQGVNAEPRTRAPSLPPTPKCGECNNCLNPKAKKACSVNRDRMAMGQPPIIMRRP